jgi:biopolymer transport protein TolR
MAIPTGTHGSWRSSRLFQPMAEINVTPFVDVMLVLLVIFMVTAPLLIAGVPVDLPKTAAASMVKPEEPLVITVTAQGKVYLHETEVTESELVEKLTAMADKAAQRLYVRGDKSVPYGRVMDVMSHLAKAGFVKVALIAEASEAPASRRAPAPPERRPGETRP